MRFRNPDDFKRILKSLKFCNEGFEGSWQKHGQTASKVKETCSKCLANKKSNSKSENDYIVRDYVVRDCID